MRALGTLARLCQTCTTNAPPAPWLYSWVSVVISSCPAAIHWAQFHATLSCWGEKVGENWNHWNLPHSRPLLHPPVCPGNVLKVLFYWRHGVAWIHCVLQFACPLDVQRLVLRFCIFGVLLLHQRFSIVFFFSLSAVCATCLVINQRMGPDSRCFLNPIQFN